MNKNQKYIILITSSFIAVLAYLLARHYFYTDLTDWQLNRAIDFVENSGSTKFSAQINSLIVAGVAFVVTSLFMLFALRGKKRRK